MEDWSDKAVCKRRRMLIYMQKILRILSRSVAPLWEHMQESSTERRIWNDVWGSGLGE